MDINKVNRIWGISLIILSVLSLITGLISIAGFEIPHLVRMIIAVVQIVAGTVLIIATVFKFKKEKKA